MQFCDKCDNMYYIKIDDNDSNKIIYYCRNCGHENTNLVTDHCISSINLSTTKLSYNNYVNQYTKLDPTLPRINNIPCPNNECSTNMKNIPREIIYIRYNPTDIKYIYLCSTCDTLWNIDN